MTTDWDDAFANMAYIPGSESLVDDWARDAAAFRAETNVQEVSYGPHPRARYDLFLPEETPKGLAVFVHGGFWMMLDKSSWSHYAAGALGQGWAVAMPSYTLTPEAKISEITTQIGAAISHAAMQVAGPIRLAGHSAGGHLVSRMMCADTPLVTDVFTRIAHTLSISGLHDLRPLLHTKMNATFGLTPKEAALESAALLHPKGTPHITAWVGGDERPEFIRQSQLLALIWAGLDARITCHIDGTHNHFSVLDGLQSPTSPITTAFVADAM
jgi:hypothetical protein